VAPLKLRLLALLLLPWFLSCGGGGGGGSTPAPAPTTYTVSFMAGTGGSITGTTSQTITSGGNTTPVTAVPNAGYTFTNWTGTGITTSIANPFTVTGVTTNLTITANFVASGTVAPIQVLMNGDFEQTSPVAWKGDTGVIQEAPGSQYPAMLPHLGTNFAWLGGYGSVASDQITQDLFIPATATSATLSFYLKIVTDEPGTAAKDSLTVAALDTAGATLGTLLTRTNLNASPYTAVTADLLPYKGRTIRLSFKSLEDAQYATSFLVDDVAASITVPQASDLKPFISSFTPTSGLAGETTLQVTGGNFFGVVGVTIGGLTATFTLTDGTTLSAAVPAGTANGSAPISITSLQGTGISATTFSVTYGVPTVTGVNPTQGPVGTPVVITGTYLGYAGTTLALNGQALTLTSQSASQLTFQVPAGASTGNLVLTTPGGAVTRTFGVTAGTSTFDLHLEKVLLTQSTQTLDNAVPIVAGKSGLIRAFVLANATNSATPAVRLTLKNNGVAVPGYPKTILAPGSGVPLALDQSTPTSSWNLVVPGTDLTTPVGTGYSLLAEVDPAGAVAEADKSNNALTVTLKGAVVPTYRTTIFPVALASGTGNVTAANKDAWAARLAKMYPVASVDVAVGTTFTGSVSSLGSDGTGWSTLLSDLATKHQADAASDRYYFGALNVSYSSGVAGLGYVPSSSASGFSARTALGWDKTGYQDGGNFPEVFAHETGHNMGCNHSPCPTSGANVPAGIDPDYPYAGGLIGQWGYDSELSHWLSPLTYKDIMAYCSPVWVSDYTYQNILSFRGGTGGFLKVLPEDAPLAEPVASARECLLVRGLVHADGSVELLPSFRTRALPSALPAEGDYRVACLDAQGAVLFSAPLELLEVGCAPTERERHFLAALPLDAPLLDAVAGLSVLRGGLPITARRGLSKAAALAAPAPESRRLAPDQVQLRWDATLHPAALVRDADSGEVIAILAGGSQSLSTGARRFDVVLSDGVSGPTHRLEAAPQ